MQIADGDTGREIYFVAVDATDFTTRETSLTGTSVDYSIDGGARTAMTTPTITAIDATNMPGVFKLAIDESGMVTVGAGNDVVELCVHIEATEMAPVTRTIEIIRPKITEGNTLDVTSTGAAGIDWANIENPTTAQNLSATNIDTDQVVASVTGAVGSVTGAVGSVTAQTTADVTAISGDSTAADKLEASLDSMTLVTAQTSSTTNVIETVLTETGTDHYKDRYLFMYTGNEAGCGRLITAYNGTTKQLTVDDFPNAPANGDLGIIV